ncbi:hypothetical protein OV450_3540 [Actinobacteria bacterium OV450]|nr:hypothetical protein OV450_3540 [Actinobacteria bacterium OV450]
MDLPAADGIPGSGRCPDGGGTAVDVTPASARRSVGVHTPAAPLLLTMAVIVQVVTWIRVALAVVRGRGAASARLVPAGPGVPESAEVRTHADRQAQEPGQ